MKGKIILLLSVVVFALFGFWVMKSLFLSNHKILHIPDKGLAFELPEKTFKLMETDGEPIRISLGQVSRKSAVIEILLGENNLKKEEIKKGASLQFIYEKNVYTLKLEDIKAKLIGEETAYFLLTKKGSTKETTAEKSVAEFINMLEQEEFVVTKKDKPFPKDRFLKKLKFKSRKLIAIDELIKKASSDFPNMSITQNNKKYTVEVWLSLKK